MIRIKVIKTGQIKKIAVNFWNNAAPVVRYSLIIVILILAGNVVTISKVQIVSPSHKNLPRLIAHAGGDLNGLKLTNSREALDQSYHEGFRYFELDISKTADGIPFLVHDWDYCNVLTKKRSLPVQPTYKQIKTVTTFPELLDLKKLARWVHKHRDVFVITDIKENNLEILGIIKKDFPEMCQKIIPQIYNFNEYEPVRNMGYDEIILTLYKVRVSDEEVIPFCRQNHLFGLTVSRTRATSEFLEKCSLLELPVYVHTINELDLYLTFRHAGAYGIYTDYFQPGTLIE